MGNFIFILALVLSILHASGNAANTPRVPITENKPDAPVSQELAVERIEPENKSAKKNTQVNKSSPQVANVQSGVFVENCNKDFNQEFLCLINAHRRSHGLNKLSYSADLNAVAYSHSHWMQKTGNFDHVGDIGLKFNERCEQQDTTCRAENLAMGFRSAKELFVMWKESPGHNKNMLGDYTKIGIGISGNYATTLFR